MSDQQSLWPFSHDPSVVGHGGAATPVRAKLDSAQVLLQKSEIHVVTQNTQQGEFFQNRLHLLFVSNGIALRPYSYFYHSFHPDTPAVIEINNPGEISPSTGGLPQQGPATTMAPFPTAVEPPNHPPTAPALVNPFNYLHTDIRQPLTPSTDCQRAVIIHVMNLVWGISSPNEFELEVVARLVFVPKTCLFLIRKTGEGKSAIVLTSLTLL
jgi:hypothetical protein